MTVCLDRQNVDALLSGLLCLDAYESALPLQLPTTEGYRRLNQSGCKEGSPLFELSLERKCQHNRPRATLETTIGLAVILTKAWHRDFVDPHPLPPHPSIMSLKSSSIEALRAPPTADFSPKSHIIQCTLRIDLPHPLSTPVKIADPLNRRVRLLYAHRCDLRELRDIEYVTPLRRVRGRFVDK